MNLYACLSDGESLYDTYAALVVAETRGKARFAMWREFGFDEALTDTRYVVRLVEKNVGRGARVIATHDEAPDLWALSKERTGIYQRLEDE